MSQADRTARGELLILTFHRVLPATDPLRDGDPTLAQFERLLGVLRRCFNVLALSQAVARLADGTLPPRALAITFDDGYADNAELAAPALARHDLPATFFIASGYLEGGAMFNDLVIEAIRDTAVAELDLGDLGHGRLPLGDIEARRRAVTAVLGAVKYQPPAQRLGLVDELCRRLRVTPATNLMMRPPQVQALARLGMEIGGHTVTHPILTRLPPAQAADEIGECRRVLADLTGQPVTGFAYPNGRPGRDYAAEHVAQVRAAGYDYAVSTGWGSARGSDDPFQLPRVALWDFTPWKAVPRLWLYLRSRQRAEAVAIPARNDDDGSAGAPAASARTTTG